VHINRAVRLAALPEAILSLLSSTGVLDGTARELLRTERELGVEELQRRAVEIDPQGRSRSEILALLKGDPKATSAYTPVAPLDRAAQFAEGVAANLWSSIAEASRQTGWNREDLSRCVAISKLPPDVLNLFEGKVLSMEVGQTLIAVQRTIGVDKMLRNAKAIHDRPKRRTVDQLINELAGSKDHFDMSLRIRGTPTTMTFEMTFDVKNADQLLIDEEEVKNHIKAILLRSPRAKR
jgi:hypothetical protein